jgi:hypothetical protein
MPAEVATIDVAELRGLLDRIAPLIAPADHATLTMLLNTHLGLLRELRESTATIARLRRLAGIESSEKTRVVLSRNKGSQNGLGPEGPSASEGDGSGVGSAPLGADPLITSSEGHRPGGEEAAAEGGPVTPPPPSSPPAPGPPGEEAEKTPEGHGRLASFCLRTPERGWRRGFPQAVLVESAPCWDADGLRFLTGGCRDSRE